MKRGPRPISLEERLLRMVRLSGECWIYDGRKQRGGYGGVGISKGHFELAHRLSYRLFRGPIPKGKLVLHECDRPACVHPLHLWIGTHAQNTMDMLKKGRAGRPSPYVRLTPVQRRKIVTLFLGGAKKLPISKRFGISISTVHYHVEKALK